MCLLADPNHGFDLVFMDLKMPRMTGNEVIKVIQDIVHVNFVILTGHPEEFLKGSEHIKILQKPIDYRVIEEIVLDTEKCLKSHKGNLTI